jgi:arsenical pump membrane protein
VWADGSALVLYGLVCGLCALATAALSLDGAVVLMVPVVLALHRRHGAPLAPLLLGAVVVVNTASIAVPQGNPTNLVLIIHAGLTPETFLATMLVPGLVATVVCAAGVAILERVALRAPLPLATADCTQFSRDERCAIAALVATALATVAALINGVAPWWPFTATTAVALVAARARVRPRVPWRVAAQVAGLVVVAGALNPPGPTSHAAGLLGLLALATILSACCAVANNLPVGAWTASIIRAGPLAYAASIGLAIGAIATPQGSVATLIATDLAGPAAPTVPVQRTVALAAAGVLTAVLLLAAGA